MRDHSDDWLREESEESIRIGQLEDRVTELELLVEKLQSQLTPLAPDVLPCGHPKSSALLLEFGSWSCQDCKRQNAGKA